jgi:small ligand-binding sensory domain FIST
MTDALDTQAGSGPACAVGVSTAPQLDIAIRSAVADARRDLATLTAADEPADLAVVFISAAYGSDIRPVCEGLADIVPARALVGTTAEGVLAAAVEYEGEPAVVVWLARLPGATVVPFALEYGQTPDGGLFTGWPETLAADWPRQASVLLLADPFSFPVDAFIKRLEEDRPGVPIVGGMASGGWQPGSNTLVVGPRTYDVGAVGVVVGGPVRLRPVVSQGCRPIGRPLVITKSEENLIIELGGRPALERLREIYSELDATDRDLVRTSLHVGRAASEYVDRFGPGDFLVRTVAGADPESGVLAVGDLIRTGQTIQFHVRDGQSAHDDLRSLLTRERATGTRPAGALVFSCNGRGSRLFDEPHHDARCLQECLGPLPAAGFFAQGEIGPIGKHTFVHGFTASIALVEPAE